MIFGCQKKTPLISGHLQLYIASHSVLFFIPTFLATSPIAVLIAPFNLLNVCRPACTHCLGTSAHHNQQPPAECNCQTTEIFPHALNMRFKYLCIEFEIESNGIAWSVRNRITRKGEYEMVLTRSVPFFIYIFFGDLEVTPLKFHISRNRKREKSSKFEGVV